MHLISDENGFQENASNRDGAARLSGCFDLRSSRLPAPVRAKATRSGGPVRRHSRGSQHDKLERIYSKTETALLHELLLKTAASVRMN